MGHLKKFEDYSINEDTSESKKLLEQRNLAEK